MIESTDQNMDAVSTVDISSATRKIPQRVIRSPLEDLKAEHIGRSYAASYPVVAPDSITSSRNHRFDEHRYCPDVTATVQLLLGANRVLHPPQDQEAQPTFENKPVDLPHPPSILVPDRAAARDGCDRHGLGWGGCKSNTFILVQNNSSSKVDRLGPVVPFERDQQQLENVPLLFL